MIKNDRERCDPSHARRGRRSGGSSRRGSGGDDAPGRAKRRRGPLSRASPPRPHHPPSLLDRSAGREDADDHEKELRRRGQCVVGDRDGHGNPIRRRSARCRRVPTFCLVYQTVARGGCRTPRPRRGRVPLEAAGSRCGRHGREEDVDLARGRPVLVSEADPELGIQSRRAPHLRPHDLPPLRPLPVARAAYACRRAGR